MTLAELLQQKLKGQNLSHLARELGIPKTLLHEWTQAKRTPSLKNVGHLKKLADHLSISLEELLIGQASEKVISSVTFADSGRRYRIKVERID